MIGKFIIPGLALLLAACTRPALAPVPEPEFRVSLSISRPDDFDSKATIKTAWEAGDVVFVFFKGVAFPKYLEMKYSGDSWTGTPKNGLVVSDLSGATDKRMTAVFLPYGNDAVVQADGLFNKAYGGYFLQCELAAYTYTDALNGSLSMVSPEFSTGKLIHLDVSGFTPGHTYTLYQDNIRPLTCSGVSDEGTVRFEEGAVGGTIPGFEFENSSFLSFSGVLDASAINVSTDYQFSINDATASTLYTRDAGVKKVEKAMSIGLGDLSSPAKWNANAYLDLDYTNAAGQHLYWATRNLGAAMSSDAGLYFAFGETTGYAAGSGHSFNVDPTYSVDANGNLLPECDAAHAAWKGLWRMPADDECDLLWKGSTKADYSFTEGSGATFTRNGQSLFVPAAGYYVGTGLNHLGEEAAVWSARESEVLQAWFLQSGKTILTTGKTYAAYGQPVRPVFSIP